MSNTAPDFLPFHLPLIEQDEIDEVVDCLQSGWLTTGPKVKVFEEEFRQAVGAKYALAVNSGTAALHLCVESAGVGSGDKVITTPFTFTATAEVIRYMGADPVFVDIDDDTLNIDPNAVVSAFENESNIKSIIPVHFAGQAADMDPIGSIADAHGCKVIEDAAHALPASYKGLAVGSISAMTVFSFYATKTLATGEGGMVTTDDPDIAERIRTMRLHGISRDVFDRSASDKPSWQYEVVAPGYKYNMTDLVAALGIHQLRKRERFHAARSDIAAKYNEAFKDLPIRLPHVAATTDIHSWHLYVIRLNLDEITIDRNRFIELMTEAGVGTSVHFIPLHMQPYWRDRYNLIDADFPVATKAYFEVVSLPIYPKMSDADCERVIATVRDILMKFAI